MDRKIVIEFDRPLLNADVTTVNPPKVADQSRALHSATASSTYSGSAAANAIDGSTSTYWRANSTTAPQWLQVDLCMALKVTKLRAYLNSYRPNQFELQGSNDELTWNVVYSGNFANVAGWQEFSVLGTYRYWRVNCLSKYSSYYYIYEVELIGPADQAAAFAVSGQEYQWQGEDGYGPLVPKTYSVLSVERYANNAILLNIDPYSRINDAVGQLTVSYDADKGDLRGYGAVEGFSISFTPTGLVPIRDPMVDEHVTARVTNLDLTLTRVYYTDAHHTEHVTARVTGLTLTLIRVSYNNP